MKSLGSWFVSCGCLAVWGLICGLRILPEYLLPGPGRVLSEFLGDADGLLGHFALTFAEAAAGLLVAIVVAFVFSAVLFLAPGVEDAILPLIVGFKAIPLVALAPLFLLWFGNGFISKSVMASSICFFPLVIGHMKGFRSLSLEEVFFLRNIRLSRGEELLRFRLIKSIPYWLAGLRVASVLAVVGAIVAEFTGARGGIGYVVIVSSVRIDTPLLMVGILLSAACGLVLYGCSVTFERCILTVVHMDPVEE